MESEQAHHVMVLDFRDELIRINEVLLGQALFACRKKLGGDILERSQGSGQLPPAGLALPLLAEDRLGQEKPHVFHLEAGGDAAFFFAKEVIEPRAAGQRRVDKVVDV
ncbi:hypothetical protein ACFQDI_01960 [Prosthecobacter fluviatilis]|uniref:Uncharacterized protein n=1 Tax=Prosthecobacter fluviatilis TaxID=445931 RepID=A0ABW0KLL5_9BACT